MKKPLRPREYATQAMSFSRSLVWSFPVVDHENSRAIKFLEGLSEGRRRRNLEIITELKALAISSVLAWLVSGKEQQELILPSLGQRWCSIPIQQPGRDTSRVTGATNLRLLADLGKVQWLVLHIR